MKKNYKVYNNLKIKDIQFLFKILDDFALKENVINKKDDFLLALQERENLSSTGLENGIAIPHGISNKILKHFIFVIKLDNQIKWKTFDNSEVDTIIAFAVPKKTENQHLKNLQNVSIMLMKKENQKLLQEFDLQKISELFEKNVFPLEENDDDAQNFTNQKSNLIQTKQKLKNNYQKSKSESDLKKIEAIELEILKCKNNIKLMKVQKKKHFLDLTERNKNDQILIKKMIAKEKQLTKKQLLKLKNNYQNKKSLLKVEINSRKNYKEKLNLLNYNYYIKKSKVLENLNKFKYEEQKLKGIFKEEKNNTNNQFTEKLKNTRFKIANPKNFLYIYGNKIQLVLMILLATLGLWGIVLGSIGVGSFESFVSSDINLWKNLNIPGFNEKALNDWSKLIVASNFNVAVLTIIFGSLNFLTILFLKFFKIQSVVNENKAIASSITGFIFIVVTAILIFLSSENINNFEIFSKQAITLNNDFQNAITLSEPLKTLLDFNGNETDYNLYKNSIQIIFESYSIDKDFTEANRLLALESAKTAASEDFNSIVLEKLIEF